MANGSFGGGSGISNDPYLIEDADDLNAMRKFPEAYYKLMSNINLGVYPYNLDKGWQPIQNFSGNLNGNNKKIVNLYINRPTDTCGLFGAVNLDNANKSLRFKVYDLTMENVDIRGGSGTGAVTGILKFTHTSARTENTDALFSNVYVSGKIQANGTQIGGISGYVMNTVNTNGQKFMIAYNCCSKIDIVLMLSTCNYISQIVGITYDYNWTFTGTYNKYIYRNCVGCGNLVKNNFNPSSIGTITIMQNSECTNSFMDSTIWKHNYVNCATTLLSTQDIKNPAKTSSLQNINNDTNIPIWLLVDGNYPELYHASPDYMFIYNGTYNVYDPVKEEWVEISKEEPSQQMAQKYGMKNLLFIPSKAWKKLDNASSSYIVNILDKFVTSKQKEAINNFAQDTNLNIENNKIFRTKISFENYGGSLTSIYV